MRVILAPMDGVLDGCMRDILTRSGAFDLCMTEFLRVTAQINPLKVFRRICPEMDKGWRTPSGTPVVLQILGSIPGAMAANAEIAVKLGAPGIDINFGCPSKSVTRKGCGAILLKEPRRIHDIVKAVRGVVPVGVSLSAKMRLGYDNTDLALENAAAIEEAGADFITVHARTRADAYSVPASWEWLARINEVSSIPIVANGDISSVEDYNRCISISGCKDVMIGRGAVSSPGLAGEIKASLAGLRPEKLAWDEIHAMITAMAEVRKGSYDDGHIGTRVKLWLVYLKKEYSEAGLCFQQVCRINEYSAMSPLPL
ncbi:MAG: tRNA-dihydrouridine synthase family protein [Proteobacteria bacterium]|nr:tRNA-dihydrouridine synthase family protein [Pseudomonadota bacterium]